MSPLLDSAPGPMLLVRDPKAPLRTPSVDELSLLLLHSLVLCSASPSGPPTEGSHEMGTQLFCRWICSNGTTVPTHSPICVASDSRDKLSWFLGHSSMKWRSGSSDLVSSSRSPRFLPLTGAMELSNESEPSSE